MTDNDEAEKDAFARRLLSIFGASLDRQIENIEYHRDRPNTGLYRPEQHELFLRARRIRDQDVKSRAVRAAAREIGVGERWITNEYFARKFAAEILAAIEREGVILIDQGQFREAKADAWDEGEVAGDEASTGHPTSNPYRETGKDTEASPTVPPKASSTR